MEKGNTKSEKKRRAKIAFWELMIRPYVSEDGTQSEDLEKLFKDRIIAWRPTNPHTLDPGGPSPGREKFEILNKGVFQMDSCEVEQTRNQMILGRFSIRDLVSSDYSIVRIGLESLILNSVNLASVKLYRHDKSDDSYHGIQWSGISKNKEVFYGSIYQSGEYVIAGKPRDLVSASLDIVSSGLRDLTNIIGKDLITDLEDLICQRILCGSMRDLLGTPHQLEELGFPDDLGRGFSSFDGLVVDTDLKGKPLGFPPDSFPGGIPGVRPTNDLCGRCTSGPATFYPPLKSRLVEHGWEFQGPRNLSGRIKCLAQVANNPLIVYAGSAGSGVWKSVNGGHTWFPTMHTEMLGIGAIAIAPTDPNVIVAGTGEYTIGQPIPSVDSGRAIYRSTNGGDTWDQVGSFFSGVSKILIDPENADLVFIAGGNGIVRYDLSTNRRLNILVKSTSDIVFDPTDANIIIAAVDDSPGILRTTNANDSFVNWSAYDSGITWYAIGGNIYHNLTKLSFNGGELIASTNDYSLEDIVQPKISIYRLNSGIWSKLTTLETSSFRTWCNTLAVDPQNPNLILAGGVKLFISKDGGQSWVELTEDLGGGRKKILTGHVDHHAALIFHFGNKIQAFVANDGGIFKSLNLNDTRAKWIKHSTGLNTMQFYTVGVAKNGKRLMGGSTQDNGLLISSDGRRYEGTAGSEGGLFEIDPDDDNTLYLDPWSSNLILFKRNAGGSTSFNRGQSAGNVIALEISQLNSDYLVCSLEENRNSGNLYFTKKGEDGILRDGWTQSNISPNTLIAALAFSPIDENIVYCGDIDGIVYRSINGGESYTRMSDSTLPTKTIGGIAVDWKNADTLYVVINDASVQEPIYKSTDSGRSWISISGSSSNALPGIPFHRILRKQGQIFIASKNSIFLSTDEGLSWDLYSAGLPNFWITDMDFDQHFKTLFISTMGWGIWSRIIGSRLVWERVDFDFRDLSINFNNSNAIHIS